MRVNISQLTKPMGMVHMSQLRPFERTVPERPATMAVQVQQLAKGDRRAVYFPKGTPLIKRPKGMESLETPEGAFFYDPKAIDSFTLLHAQDSGRLNEVLGAADGGMGPESKADATASGNPVAVVGKSPNGVITQGTLASPDGIPQAARQVGKVTPRSGSVSIESPRKTVADRK